MTTPEGSAEVRQVGRAASGHASSCCRQQDIRDRETEPICPRGLELLSVTVDLIFQGPPKV